MFAVAYETFINIDKLPDDAFEVVTATMIVQSDSPLIGKNIRIGVDLGFGFGSPVSKALIIITKKILTTGLNM